MSKETILVVGSSGQIGTELIVRLREIYGVENVIAADIRRPGNTSGPFAELDIMDSEALFGIVKKYGVTQIYLLAALLSATAEKFPQKGWDLNMKGLFNVLDLAKEKHISKIYWPSSIAVFGPTTPKLDTPQETIASPTTVYGISKLAGERWCEYYFQKYGVDVRSLRYPGLIGYQSEPGGGTTDYAVHIFYDAIKSGSYTCFLKADTRLPMMYMPDGIKATVNLMEAPADKVKVRSSYNLAAMSFTPEEIAAEIRRHIPTFEISYNPDFRQQIAESWPASIDDSAARNDWAWNHDYDLARMTEDMLVNIRKKNSEDILA